MNRRTYRPRMMLTFWWVVVGVSVVYVAGLLIGEALDPVSSRHLAVLAALVIAPVAIVAFMRRYAMVTAVIDTAGITVRNPRQTIVVPRIDCLAVERSADGRWVDLLTRSGGRIRVWAWSDGWRWQMDAKVAQLNHDLLSDPGEVIPPPEVEPD